MKKNLNPSPNSIKEDKQAETDNKSNVKCEDTSYDLSNVGDAALLAVLSENSSDNANDDNGENRDNTDNSVNNKNDETPDGPNCNADSAKALKSLLSLAVKLLNGEITEERLARLMDASIALEEIEQARKEGEIAGRNAVIEERLRPVETGAPDLNGSPAPHRSRKASIFDLALKAR